MAGHLFFFKQKTAYEMNVGGRNDLALAVLRGRYYEFVSTMRAGGGHLLAFRSPCCETQTQTLAPEDNNVWDTTCTCPWCGQLYAKIVSHDEVKAFVPAAGMAS